MPRRKTPTVFGNIIRKMRTTHGISLRELERMTGVSNAMLSQIELGHVKDPGFSTVVKLSRAFGLSLNYIAERAYPVQGGLGVGEGEGKKA